jgi:hypothetical protein
MEANHILAFEDIKLAVYHSPLLVMHGYEFFFLVFLPLRVSDTLT